MLLLSPSSRRDEQISRPYEETYDRETLQLWRDGLSLEFWEPLPLSATFTNRSFHDEGNVH